MKSRIEKIIRNWINGLFPETKEQKQEYDIIVLCGDEKKAKILFNEARQYGDRYCMILESCNKYLRMGKEIDDLIDWVEGFKY